MKPHKGNVVKCGKCEDCEKQKRMLWIGRLGGEAHTAQTTWFVTLTVDAEHVKNATPDICQQWFREYMDMLRRKHVVRAFAVYELGEKRRRPHIHAVLFFYGKPPEIPLNVRAKHANWAKGFSQYELPKTMGGAMGYIYGYLDKGGVVIHRSQGLGKEYLLQHVAAKALMRNKLVNEYGIHFTVAGMYKRDRKTGGEAKKLWDYYIGTGHHWTAQLCEHYVKKWREFHDEYPPMAQFANVSNMDWD